MIINEVNFLMRCNNRIYTDSKNPQSRDCGTLQADPLKNSPEGEQERLCRNRGKPFKSPQPKFLGYSLWSNRFTQRVHHIFDKAKVKIEPSVRKSICRHECDRDLRKTWPGFETDSLQRLTHTHKDLTRFL